MPLAGALKALTGLLAVVAVLVGGAVVFLTLQMQQQVARLTALDEIESLRQVVFPSFVEAQFLQSDESAAAISERLTQLQSALSQFQALAPRDPRVASASSGAAAIQDLLQETTHHGTSAARYLEQVTEGIDLFRDEGQQWTNQAVSRRRAALYVAESVEDKQRRMSGELLALSNSIFAATRLLNELEAFRRYAVSEAGRRAPLAVVPLSVAELPPPCFEIIERIPLTNCKLSPDRANRALATLRGSPIDQRENAIIDTSRAIAAFIRSGELQYQSISDQLLVNLELGVSVRESLEAHAEIYDLLADLTTALADTDQMLDRVRGGQVSDWRLLDIGMRDQIETIRAISSTLATASTIGGGRDNQIIPAYQLAMQAWTRSYGHLADTSKAQGQLVQAVQRMNADILLLSQTQRENARLTTSYLSTLALSAMVVLVVVALGLVWAGQSFVARPLAQTTRTILDLSSGAQIGPVRLNRRSLGLGVLEDALETLRLANVEREKLTQETIEQRTEIQNNLEALARKTMEMAHLARHDPLTGLGNRRYADEYLADLSDRRETPFADFILLHVDIDRFKEINDTLGHEAGDTVLRHVARVLGELLGDGDTAFRIGGDEFLIVMTGQHDPDRFHQLAEQIIAALNKPVEYKGHSCRIGASIGVAHGSDADFDGREALVNADIALYEAKSSGRNRMVEFSKVLQDRTITRKKMADRLVQALDDEEFIPYYQPQFFADTLELRGLETLCRWQHPEMGILSPAHFMDQAEASMLLGKIDEQLLRKAAEDMKRLREAGLVIPKISFNVTADRLTHSGFTRSLLDHIGPHMKIGIELLESMSLDSLSETVRWAIDDLKEAGVGIEIDDFGSCRASIAGLIAVGPDAMKIDGSIVRPITESEQHLQLLRAIIEIGRTLDIEVIAERVETMDHVRILRENGCAILQGYALAKPMSATDLLEFLSGEGAAARRTA